jgi:sulfonate transport system permease protein
MTHTAAISLQFAGDAAAPSPAPRRRASRPRGAGWLLPLALVLAWQCAASLGVIADAAMPSPLAALAAAWRLTLTGELPQDVWPSLVRALTGLAVGGGVGFALGLANGLSRFSVNRADTASQMARNAPPIALIALAIVWLGVEKDAELFVVSLGVFFPVCLNTLRGVRSVDPQLVEMARSCGFGGVRLFRRVILPGALSSIFVGLRFALGFMWLTLIVAETVAAQSSVGYMATQARAFMLVDAIALAVFVYALFGMLADATARARTPLSFLASRVSGQFMRRS